MLEIFGFNAFSNVSKKPYLMLILMLPTQFNAFFCVWFNAFLGGGGGGGEGITTQQSVAGRPKGAIAKHGAPWVGQ